MKTRLAFMAAVASLLLAYSLPVAAQDTAVTFNVQSGSPAISVPAAADLGTGDPGQTQSGQMGVVTVTDERAALVAAWTASASSTAFTTGGGTADETIPNSAVRYWSGIATATNGNGTFTPAQVSSAVAVALNQQRTAFSLTAGVGSRPPGAARRPRPGPPHTARPRRRSPAPRY